ncbi:MAG TPA: TauD/TfdA family dioxygenase, partial [Acidimicrobiales bacterium]
DSVAVLSMQPSEPGAQRGTLEDVALPWHLDGPAMPKPYPGLSLHALDLIDGETATYFASGALAYAALPDDLRRRIEHLRGIHILPAAPERHNTPDDLIGLQDDWPRGVHDLVQVHPVTGVPFLFVGLQATVGVEGLTDEDGEELLQALFASYYRPEAIYEHRWRNGDLVIWDNRATNHRRSDLTGVSRRTLQRVQLADQSFRDAFPDFVPRGSYLKKIFGSYRAEEQVAGPTRSAS